MILFPSQIAVPSVRITPHIIAQICQTEQGSHQKSAGNQYNPPRAGEKRVFRQGQYAAP